MLGIDAGVTVAETAPAGLFSPATMSQVGAAGPVELSPEIGAALGAKGAYGPSALKAGNRARKLLGQGQEEQRPAPTPQPRPRKREARPMRPQADPIGGALLAAYQADNPQQAALLRMILEMGRGGGR
jgi:hypothetical protein